MRSKKAKVPAVLSDEPEGRRPPRAGPAHESRIGDNRDDSHVFPRADPTTSVSSCSPAAQRWVDEFVALLTRRRTCRDPLGCALDDHSRLTYTEELPDELGSTAAGFWARAVKFFRLHGIRRIRRVLSDNGACYRSRAFALALRVSHSRHKRTRPYRPQTNGKVERYHRTLAREWAYTEAWSSNDERAAALATSRQVVDYDHRQPHAI
jgi:transposase InsO family protein